MRFTATQTTIKALPVLINVFKSRTAIDEIFKTAENIYDNKTVMALLDIKDRYLKNLRDNGLLGYSRHGDKYWYTQSDIDRFLARCHHKPFAD